MRYRFIVGKRKPSVARIIVRSFIDLSSNLIIGKTRRLVFRQKLRAATCKWDISGEIDYSGYVKELKQVKGIIFCHFVGDAYFLELLRDAYKLRYKVVLMSHSPEAPSSEFFNTTRIKYPVNQSFSKWILEKWSAIEYQAFLNCDVLLFPSKEAMEPYLNTISWFRDLLKAKTVVFLRTGCDGLRCSEDVLTLRHKFGIRTRFVVSYVGRHTKIKGYENFMSIGMELINRCRDITILVGGGGEREYSAPVHERWVELGRCNPAEVFSVADVFVLANEQTYFDLILLEALSLGVKTYASDTGGNRTVYNDTGVIELCRQPQEYVEKILGFLEKEATDYNRQETVNAFISNYSLEVFARNFDACCNGLRDSVL